MLINEKSCETPVSFDTSDPWGNLYDTYGTEALDKLSFCSTGGGASLELLEGKVLPGIGSLTEK